MQKVPAVGIPGSEPEWVQDRLHLKHEVLSLEPSEGTDYHEHSTGGSLPSAWAAPGAAGTTYPASTAAGTLLSGGRSPHSSGWGSYAGGLNASVLPLAVLLRAPSVPRRSLGLGPPVLPSMEECSHSPSAASAGGSRASPREDPSPLGLSWTVGERNTAGNLGDCSNRERSMNISLRWLKLLNNITKPNVLAGI